MTDLKATIARQNSLNQATKMLENQMQPTSIAVERFGSTYKQVIIATQAVDGVVHLLLTTVPIAAENVQCLREVQKEYSQTISKQRMSRWRCMFMKSIVGTAQVQIHSITANQDHLPQHSSAIVLLYDFIYDEVLNHYWQNPSSLTRRKLRTIRGHDLVFNLSGRQHITGERVIVVRQVVSKMKVVLMLFVLLVLGGIVGIVTGLMTSRADIAIAVSAGSFAFVAVIQSLVAWLSA